MPKEGWISIIEITIRTASWLAHTGTRAHFTVLWDSQRPCSTQWDRFLSGTIIMGLLTKFTKVRVTTLWLPWTCDRPALRSVFAVLQDSLSHKERSGFSSWPLCTGLSFLLRGEALLLWDCISLPLGKMGRCHLGILLAPPSRCVLVVQLCKCSKSGLPTGSWLLGSAQGSSILHCLLIAAIEKAPQGKGLRRLSKLHLWFGILTISS